MALQQFGLRVGQQHLTRKVSCSHHFVLSYGSEYVTYFSKILVCLKRYTEFWCLVSFQMYKIPAVVLILTATALAAEITSSYDLLEKNAAFQPDLKTEPIESYAVFKKDSKDERRPVYRAESRVHIEPVKPSSPIAKHDMLADQPAGTTEINRVVSFT